VSIPGGGGGTAHEPSRIIHQRDTTERRARRVLRRVEERVFLIEKKLGDYDRERLIDSGKDLMKWIQDNVDTGLDWIGLDWIE
jgi:hypothetical protein